MKFTKMLKQKEPARVCCQLSYISEYDTPTFTHKLRENQKGLKFKLYESERWNLGSNALCQCLNLEPKASVLPNSAAFSFKQILEPQLQLVTFSFSIVLQQITKNQTPKAYPTKFIYYRNSSTFSSFGHAEEGHRMASIQTPSRMQSSALLETSCGYLLQELQIIWDEVGEDQSEREKVLLNLEQECLEVYRRKVDSANISRARLHQELAESEAEFTHLLLSLGERSLPGRPEKLSGTLKEQLDAINPALREMRLRKEERVNQFRSVQEQIQKISAEIAGQSVYDDSVTNVIVNENDLSMKKLEEYQTELQGLRNEKEDRLQQVENYIDTIHKLSATLGMESSMIITKVHPTLNKLCGISKNISDNILAKLNSTVESLKEEKYKRLEKLHHFGKQLTNLWNLMDTPYGDRQLWSHVTSMLPLSSAEVSNPGTLTLSIIQQVEAEVKRLDQLKAYKMKELFFKKHNELESICNKMHMEIPSRAEIDNIIALIDSGEIDHADLLISMDQQISKAKEEASSRKEIMEKVERWILARDEERWLEEYSMDENRYSVSRGAHKNLRRAERARVIVNKIPTLVASLIAKTKSWEEERKKVFLFDDVPLLAMLEEYNMSRQEREDQKQRLREKKKVQVPIAVELDNAFGSRPSTSSRRLLNRSLNRGFSNGSLLNKRLSLSIQQPGPNSTISATPGTSSLREQRKIPRQKKTTPPSLASHLRDETASVVSTFSGPLSP